MGLDPQVQQDAAEFSKLFISLLESSLSCQTDAQVRQIVQNQFRGEYAYVTKCCHCQRESKTPSYFYELDLPLQGQKTLLSCLQDFLKDEKLEGDNQYLCQVSTRQYTVIQYKLRNVAALLLALCESEF